MPILLTIAATVVFFALWPVLANIWEVGERTYIAARWAIALWVLTIDAGLWAAVYLTYH